MTTDITELAQSLKAAANREMISRDQGETSIIWQDSASPENILALVEALEKARAKNALVAGGIEAAAKLHERIIELESKNAIANEKVDELSRLAQHNMSRAEGAERRAERLSSSSLLHPGLLHATNELVLMFSYALADKLYAAQEKYRHGTSWRNADWEDACQRDFQKHIAKGDPRDVAAYCAFMWWHGWSTKPAEALESRTVKLPAGTEINGFHMLIESEVVARLSEACIDAEVFRAPRAAGAREAE